MAGPVTAHAILGSVVISQRYTVRHNVDDNNLKITGDLLSEFV